MLLLQLDQMRVVNPSKSNIFHWPAVCVAKILLENEVFLLKRGFTIYCFRLDWFVRRSFTCFSCKMRISTLLLASILLVISFSQLDAGTNNSGSPRKNDRITKG